MSPAAYLGPKLGFLSISLCKVCLHTTNNNVNYDGFDSASSLLFISIVITGKNTNLIKNIALGQTWYIKQMRRNVYSQDVIGVLSFVVKCFTKF